MRYATLIAALLFASTAQAQDMDEATKIKILRRAWQLNGCSMVRVGAIDMTRYDMSGKQLATMSDLDWDTFIHSIPTLMTQSSPVVYPPAIGGGPR
jgi:hypothetical protein